MFLTTFIAGLIFMLTFMAFLAVFGKKDTATGKEKACIVLGAALYKGKPSRTLKFRLDKAYELYLENNDMIFVVTGGKEKKEYKTEAAVMREYLIEKGIPNSNIICEDKSRSTLENFVFTKMILKENGINSNEKIAVVTSAFHIVRSKHIAEDYGFTNITTLSSGVPVAVAFPVYIREVAAYLRYLLLLRKPI